MFNRSQTRGKKMGLFGNDGIPPTLQWHNPVYTKYKVFDLPIVDAMDISPNADFVKKCITEFIGSTDNPSNEFMEVPVTNISIDIIGRTLVITQLLQRYLKVIQSNIYPPFINYNRKGAGIEP